MPIAWSVLRRVGHRGSALTKAVVGGWSQRGATAATGVSIRSMSGMK